MKNSVMKMLGRSFGKGLAFGLGLLTSALLAVTISGTINSFSSGDTISSSKINENFTSLQTAINNIPLGTYCGATAASYTGGSFGAYTGAKSLCATACSDTRAHMCTSHEVTMSLQAGISLGSITQWISSFHRSDIAATKSDDCIGWTDSSGGNYGYIINSTNAPGSRLCNETHPIACCL